MVISHRGNDIYGYKENTKQAIISTLRSSYVSGVECDIRLTKDNKLVLNHSFIHNNKIIKYNKARTLKLITLNNLLKSIKTKKLIIIEIKDNDKKIIDILYKIIKKYKHLNIIIHTIYYELALSFKNKYPKCKIGLIILNIINSNKDISKLDFVSLHYKVDKKYAKETFIWTVNNKKDIKKYYLQKINIITDKPYILAFT